MNITSEESQWRVTTLAGLKISKKKKARYMIYFPFSPLMPCENLNFSKIYVSWSIHSAINVPLPTTGLIINTELMSSCLAFSPPTQEANLPKSKSCSQDRQLFQPGCSSGGAVGLFSAILQMCIPSSTRYREEKNINYEVFKRGFF